MRGNKKDETIEYDPSSALDDVLRTYEIDADESVKGTSAQEEDSCEKDVSELGALNEESCDSSGESVKKRPVKLIAIIAAVCAVLLLAAAGFYFFLNHADAAGVNAVYRKSDGNIYVLSDNARNSKKLGYTVDKYKISEDAGIMAFVSGGKLYLCRVYEAEKKDFVSLVSESADEDFYIMGSEYLVYSRDKAAYVYSVESGESKQLVSGYSQLFVPSEGKYCFFTKKDGEKISLFRMDITASEELLSSDAESVQMYDDGEKARIVYVENGSDGNYVLSFADSDGQKAVLTRKAAGFYCGESDEVWDNIYYFTENKSSSSVSVVFTDSMKESDENMKEPDPDDYKKTIGITGLFTYTDANAYKQAYIAYQEKIARDNAREFASNYTSSQKSILLCDVYVFCSGNTNKLAEKVSVDKIKSYSKSGKAHIVYDKITMSSGGTLEIADLAKEINGGDSQEDFNKLVSGKVKSEIKNEGVFLASTTGDTSFTSNEFDKNDAENLKYDFSPDGETLLVTVSGTDGADTLYSYEINESGQLKNQLANVNIESYAYSEKSFWFIRKTSADGGTLCRADIGGSYSEYEEKAENISSFEVREDGITAYQNNSDESVNVILVSSESVTKAGENVQKDSVRFMGKNEVLYISSGNLMLFDGKECVSIDTDVEELFVK